MTRQLVPVDAASAPRIGDSLPEYVSKLGVDPRVPGDRHTRIDGVEGEQLKLPRGARDSRIRPRTSTRAVPSPARLTLRPAMAYALRVI